MRPRLRAAGILAVLGAGTLLLSAAVPSGAPALFSAPAGFDPARTPEGQPIVQTSTEPPPGAVAPKTAIQELRTMGALQLDSSGTVRSITAPPGESLGANGDVFVKRYAGAFGLTKSHSLVRTQTVGVPGGDQVVRYQQTAGGLPVLGGEVVITTGKNGAVQGAITDTTPLAPSGGAAKLDPAAAQSKALAAATATYEIDPATVSTSSSLWLYTAPGKAQLRPTYWVKLGENQHEVATVLVDAIDGSIKLVASEHQAAKNRAVCDAANIRRNLNKRLEYVCNQYSQLGTQGSTRLEGGPVSSSSEVNAAFDRLGVAYDYFKTNFGRDSYDGRGEQIRATVRACDLTSPCPFENAFWEGYQFVFGQGWATDDVAAHEYTHAVTEHASSLYYWHQSGAINEALSDIFGEFIDLSTPGDGTDDTTKRWQMGENLPAGPYHPGGGAIRNLMDPHAHGDPAYYREYPYWSETYDNWDNGGVHTNSGPANRMAALIADGSAANGITGIGLSKSAQLWYRIMHLLPSGANYDQLVVTAKAACRQLINKGMTVADCDSVTKAAGLIFPNYQPSEGNLCDDSPSSNLGQRPYSVLFSDDMEQGGAKWNRSDSYFWQFIPNSQIDYAYAAHGRGSLNGWAAGQGGHGTSAEMATWVNIASGSGLTPWVSFNFSAIQNGSPNGSIGVEAFINNGSGWAPLSLEGMGNRMSSTTGYWYKRANLSAYAGQNVKVKFQVNSPNNALVDWYLDDFTIFNCQYARPGAPQDAFGYFDGADLKLTWATYLYNADPRNPQNHHFEFTYSPAIPGAPETYRATPAQADDLRRTVTVTGADPAQRYTITVRVRMDDGSGLLGPATTIVVDPKAPVVCPTSKPVSVTVPWSGRRPMPGLGAEQCFRTPTPRR